MALLRWGLHVAAACFTRPRPPAAGRAAVALAALSPAGADRPGGVDFRPGGGGRGAEEVAVEYKAAPAEELPPDLPSIDPLPDQLEPPKPPQRAEAHKKPEPKK